MPKLAYLLLGTLIAFLALTRTEYSEVSATHVNLAGTWSWTDVTSGGATYPGTATISHPSDSDISWTMTQTAGPVWNGTGTLSGLTLHIDGQSGAFTADFDGTIAADAQSITGTWIQSDGTNGTFEAIRQSSTSLDAFTDDFDDGDANGWTETLGTWTVISGRYATQAPVPVNHVSVVPGTVCDTCTIEATVRAGTNEVGFKHGLVFRYLGVESYYRFWMSNEYQVVGFDRCSPGGPPQCHTGIDVSYPMAYNTDYRLRVEIDGTHFRGFVNGILAVEWDDTSYTLGSVGLFAHRSAASFDDFSLIPGVPPPLPEPAVLLVHGWNSDCGAWSDLEPWLVTRMGLSSERVACFGYATDGGVARAAVQLKNYVESFAAQKAPLPDGKIDLVAHSMGGLVARYYIEKLGGSSRVRHLVMLGTPNLGTRMADLNVFNDTLPCRLAAYFPFSGAHRDNCNRDRSDGEIDDWGTWDMRTESGNGGLLYFLNTEFSGTGDTAYTLLAGDWSAPAYDALFDEPNDCVVSVRSVQGPFDELTIRNVSHPGWCSAAPAGLTTDSSEDCTSNPAHIFCDVLNALYDSPAFAGISSSQDVVVQGDAPRDSGDLSIIGGLVLDGETAEHAIDVDAAAGRTTFALTWQGASDAIGLALERPGGIPVSPDDPDVTYGASGEIVPGIYQEAYTIDAPSSGEWMVAVQALNVPPDGQPYAVLAAMDRPVTLSLSFSPSSLLPNGGVDIEATVLEGGAAIAGASATATITTPGLTQVVIPLADEGSGTFGGAFTDTAACGVYQIAVHATGEASSGAFSRDSAGFLDVHIPGDATGDPCDADEDDDGADDTSEIFCGSDPTEASFAPERVDGAHSGVDDNGDGLIDEVLPESASMYDCDGDGLTGDEEVALTTNPQTPDTDADSAADGADNCPNWPNATQALPSWPVPTGDADCDGFPDSVNAGGKARETYIGTDPLQHCAATPGANNDPLPDAWPPDFNDDQAVNGQDVGKYGGPFGAGNHLVSQGPFGPPGQEIPGVRFDFNGDGAINGQDSGKFQAYYNKVCAPSGP